MSWTRLLALALAAALFCGTARADLYVLLNNGQIATDDDLLMWQDWQSGNWHIIIQQLYNPGGVSLYEIRGNGGETIERIIIHVPCWQGPGGQCVPAGSPVFVRVISEPPHGIRSVHKIEQTGTAETLLTHVIVTEDIGAVTAQAIGILNAGRDVVGPITSFTPDNPIRGISEVYAGRHIVGALTALNGKVGIVHAAENIGTPDDPVTIRFKYNPLDIQGLDVHADIDTRIGEAMGGTGSLWRLEAARFFGTLKAHGMAYHATTGAAGSIRIHERLIGTIEFGGSFNDANHIVELPIAGVEGQILINADNAGGTWTAPMHFGKLNDPDHALIAGPAYTQTSAELGGGAIGVVPFRLHHASSNPASNSLVELAYGDDPLTVELEHYGPVHVTSSSPVTILRRPLEGGIYVSVPLSNFTFGISTSNPRVLRVGAAPGAVGFEPGYEYRITANSALRSSAAGNPPVTWSLPYYVSVTEADQDPIDPPCLGDLNGDGSVGVPDLLLLLSNWGSCAQSNCPADLNEDSWVGVPDLLMLLSNWGPCPR